MILKAGTKGFSKEMQLEYDKVRQQLGMKEAEAKNLKE